MRVKDAIPGGVVTDRWGSAYLVDGPGVERVFKRSDWAARMAQREVDKEILSGIQEFFGMNVRLHPEGVLVQAPPEQVARFLGISPSE